MLRVPVKRLSVFVENGADVSGTQVFGGIDDRCSCDPGDAAQFLVHLRILPSVPLEIELPLLGADRLQGSQSASLEHRLRVQFGSTGHVQDQVHVFSGQLVPDEAREVIAGLEELLVAGPVCREHDRRNVG
ncbi:MAG: hypothetical protein U1F35_17485 [Steroidobacteraceae bacterium]